MERRTTFIIVILIFAILIGLMIIVALVLIPYFTQEGITAKDAKEICDEHLAGEGKTLSFYSMNTDSDMIRAGEFDYWYVEYHGPPDQNNYIKVETYKVTREEDVTYQTYQSFIYQGPIPGKWDLDSDQAYRIAKDHPEVGDYLDDNDDDVVVEDFTLRYSNATRSFVWYLHFKNDGFQETHRAELALNADTGQVLDAKVEYH